MNSLDVPNQVVEFARDFSAESVLFARGATIQHACVDHWVSFQDLEGRRILGKASKGFVGHIGRLENWLAV